MNPGRRLQRGAASLIIGVVIAISLQSGSNGNCIYVESGDVRLLLDAGISGIQAQTRLARYGRDIRRVSAVILSHDHRDHVACAGVYQRKFNLPIYVTRRTFDACRRWSPLGQLHDVRHFRAGRTIDFGQVKVHTVPTPHDGADGVAFVVAAEGKRIGVLTDLGHPFDGLAGLIGGLHGLFLESNYDLEMLLNGRYPQFLKDRICGPGGHLSNFEAAELLVAAAPRNLQWICLSHLSEENNEPRLALRTHERIAGSIAPFHVASRYEPTGEFVV